MIKDLLLIENRIFGQDLQDHQDLFSFFSVFCTQPFSHRLLNIVWKEVLKAIVVQRLL
jgi:hypothetical protein